MRELRAETCQWPPATAKLKVKDMPKSRSQLPQERMHNPESISLQAKSLETACGSGRRQSNTQSARFSQDGIKIIEQHSLRQQAT
jgi:hypothetical protein